METEKEKELRATIEKLQRQLEVKVPAATVPSAPAPPPPSPLSPLPPLLPLPPSPPPPSSPPLPSAITRCKSLPELSRPTSLLYGPGATQASQLERRKYNDCTFNLVLSIMLRNTSLLINKINNFPLLQRNVG